MDFFEVFIRVSDISLSRYNMPLHGHEEPLTAPRWFVTAPVWGFLIILFFAATLLIFSALEWDMPVLVVIGVLVYAFGLLVAIVMHRSYYRPPRQN